MAAHQTHFSQSDSGLGFLPAVQRCWFVELFDSPPTPVEDHWLLVVFQEDVTLVLLRTDVDICDVMRTHVDVCVI